MFRKKKSHLNGKKKQNKRKQKGKKNNIYIYMSNGH